MPLSPIMERDNFLRIRQYRIMDTTTWIVTLTANTVHNRSQPGAENGMNGGDQTSQKCDKTGRIGTLCMNATGISVSSMDTFVGTREGVLYAINVEAVTACHSATIRCRFFRVT